jgi:hypothetical protein
MNKFRILLFFSLVRRKITQVFVAKNGYADAFEFLSCVQDDKGFSKKKNKLKKNAQAIKKGRCIFLWE